MENIFKISSKVRDEIIDIVYTSYNNGDMLVKEQKLQNCFDYHKIDYTRKTVKDIVYHEYKSHGGYKDYDEFTDWIFPQ